MAAASYASATGQAGPAPSTLFIPLTLSPTATGSPTSTATLTLTLNPIPTGPAFSSFPGVSPAPAVPDDNVPCASLDALASSCTTLASFDGLPLSAQAQCLCNVGPWDAVADACFAQLTVLGQFYASSLTSHGLLGLCSTYRAGPTWPASVVASISAVGASAALTETQLGTPTRGSGSGSAVGNLTVTVTGAASATQSPSHNAAPAAAWSLAEVSERTESPVTDPDVDIDVADGARPGCRHLCGFCRGYWACSRRVQQGREKRARPPRRRLVETGMGHDGSGIEQPIIAVHLVGGTGLHTRIMLMASRKLAQ